MCEFGALTLKPAPLVSVKAQNLHITQTQNNHHNANMLHELCKTFSSNTTYDRFSNRVLTWSNDQKSFDMCYLADNVFLRDNLHFSGTLKGSSYCPRQCTHILTTNRTISNITTHYRWEWSGVIISFSRGILLTDRICILWADLSHCGHTASFEQIFLRTIPCPGELKFYLRERDFFLLCSHFIEN